MLCWETSSISPLLYCGYLGYAPPFIGRVGGILNCWYGFFLGLALLYEPYGVGDYKGQYTLTGPLPACTFGAQHWGATQYTDNHACSRTVHVLHTRVVTFGPKHVGI